MSHLMHQGQAMNRLPLLLVAEACIGQRDQADSPTRKDSIK